VCLKFFLPYRWDVCECVNSAGCANGGSCEGNFYCNVGSLFEPTELDDVEERRISMNTQFKIQIR